MEECTIFVTNCELELLSEKSSSCSTGVGDRLCSNSGSRTTGSLHTRLAAADEQLAVVYVKLISVLVLHWTPDRDLLRVPP